MDVKLFHIIWRQVCSRHILLDLSNDLVTGVGQQSFRDTFISPHVDHISDISSSDATSQPVMFMFDNKMFPSNCLCSFKVSLVRALSVPASLYVQSCRHMH